MRAIDADTAISLIQEDKIDGKTFDIMNALGDGLQAETLNLTCDRHIKIINSLPTLEVEPIKHGQWIRLEYATCSCTLCGTTFILMQGNSNMNYCPNCGARMVDGVEE